VPRVSTPLPFNTPQRLLSGETLKVACLGDSITGVYYHSGGRRAWPEVLGIYLQQLYPESLVEINNAGISGNTSAQGLARLESDVLAHSPHLLVVMFGMNDVVHATMADYEANLRAIITRSMEQQIEVILMTPNYVYDEDPARPLAKLASYAETMRRVGLELGVPVADAFSAFRTVHDQGAHQWMRLMSDPVHPNMCGHRLFAALAAETITGRKIDPTELPPFSENLPHLQQLSRTRKSVKIVAMTPFDELIKSALSRLFPDLSVTVVPWKTKGKSITELEQEVMQIGWTMYRENPSLTEPDLFIVTAPDNFFGVSPEQFYRSFAIILNRAQSFGKPRWDCLVALPSVINPDLSEDQRQLQQLALNAALDKDLPIMQRPPGETTATLDLLITKLKALLSLHDSSGR